METIQKFPELNVKALSIKQTSNAGNESQQRKSRLTFGKSQKFAQLSQNNRHSDDNNKHAIFLL